MFSSLANRDFRYLWIGNLGATFAMQMQMVARGWLIYDMTRSPMDLAWVMLSFSLPMILFSSAPTCSVSAWAASSPPMAKECTASTIRSPAAAMTGHRSSLAVDLPRRATV